MKATAKKLSLNTNTRNELSDLNLNCVNTCTHTKLTLNCHIKDTDRHCKGKNANHFICNYHYLNFKCNYHDLCREVVFNTGCYQEHQCTCRPPWPRPWLRRGVAHLCASCSGLSSPRPWGMSSDMWARCTWKAFLLCGVSCGCSRPISLWNFYHISGM